MITGKLGKQIDSLKHDLFAQKLDINPDKNEISEELCKLIKSEYSSSLRFPENLYLISSYSQIGYNFLRNLLLYQDYNQLIPISKKK